MELERCVTAHGVGGCPCPVARHPLGGGHEGASGARRVAHRVHGEPARHRRSEAAPELAAPIGRARGRPVGLRDSGGPERGTLQEGHDLVWSTGRVASDESTQIAYGGPAPSSRERLYWQVRVWDGGGRASPWSDPAFWEMGLLQASDWQAAGSSPASPTMHRSRAGAHAASGVQGGGDVASARAYVTSHGLYEMHLNGRRVGDELFTPGWTSYNKRLQYQTYDVTSLLKSGDNAVGVLLGNGWYRGELAWEGRRALYGKTLGLLCQIEITLPRRTPRDRGQRRALEGVDRAHPHVGDLPRRDLRRAPRKDGLELARLRRPAMVGREDRRALARTRSSPPQGPRCAASRS